MPIRNHCWIDWNENIYIKMISLTLKKKKHISMINTYEVTSHLFKWYLMNTSWLPTVFMKSPPISSALSSDTSLSIEFKGISAMPL